MKRIFTLSKVLAGIFVFVAFNAFTTLEFSLIDAPLAPVESPDHLTAKMFKSQLALMKKKYGRRKTIDPYLEAPCLAALSFYPELKDVRIIFERSAIDFTMQTQPEMDFLLLEKSARTYCITVNTNCGVRKGVNLRELSFNALTGWIGHELAHIADYERLSASGIVGYGTAYLFDEPRRIIERRTDLIAIQHGLGYPLLEGVQFLIDSKTADAEYKKGLINHYLSPGEIVGEIKKRVRKPVLEAGIIEKRRQ